jgi:hypothetical protein
MQLVHTEEVIGLPRHGHPQLMATSVGPGFRRGRGDSNRNHSRTRANGCSRERRSPGRTANEQFKTVLRGPGRILRSGSLELVRQEIWGYLLTAWAVSALISDAAAAAWIDPGRVSFTKAIRIVRRAPGPAFPPQQLTASWRARWPI